MQHDRVRPHLSGEADVSDDLQRRHLPRLSVEGRKGVELRRAARRRERHRGERVDAADGNLVQHRLETRALLQRRMKTELKLSESEFNRLLGDRATVSDAAVAPVRGERELHSSFASGQVIRSVMKHKTASSFSERSDCRHASSTASTLRNAWNLGSRSSTIQRRTKLMIVLKNAFLTLATSVSSASSLSSARISASRFPAWAFSKTASIPDVSKISAISSYASPSRTPSVSGRSTR